MKLEKAYVDVSRVVSLKQITAVHKFLEIEFLVDGEVEPTKKYTDKQKYRGYVTKVYFDKSYDLYAYDVVIC